MPPDGKVAPTAAPTAALLRTIVTMRGALQRERLLADLLRENELLQQLSQRLPDRGV